MVKYSKLYAQVAYAWQAGPHRLRRAWRQGAAKRQETKVDVTLSGSWEADMWTLTAAVLGRLRELVRRDGAQFVIALMDTDVPTKRALIDHCKSHHIPCIDIAADLEKSGSSNTAIRLPDDPHLSQAGQAIVAEATLNFLQNSMGWPVLKAEK
ncbi:MAG: hypothetical protein L0Z68_06285 [Gammaproteobacteria bacterium]|nr:hypothetical protein [Gammaproteobacteria bacterium]